jgi:hypothetical protein
MRRPNSDEEFRDSSVASGKALANDSLTGQCVNLHHSIAVLLIAGVTVGPASLFGHHSLSAEFDFEKHIRLTGTVTRVEWGNPHVWFYIDVKEQSGKVRTWAVQLPSPNILAKRGWSRGPFAAGTRVNASGYAAKDGSNRANAREVTSSDGRTLFAATSG